MEEGSEEDDPSLLKTHREIFMAEMAVHCRCKRIPRGFDADHEHGVDLRRKSFAVHRNLSDAAVCAVDLPEQLTGIYQQTTPLVEFVCDALDLPF